MECVKMLATEVLTPASNWSSYPPHKHDENVGEETELEEIYYYLFASAAPADNERARNAKSVGYQRVYGTDRAPDRGAGGGAPTGTPCWFRTAGTGRASPRRRITCTT